MMADEPHQDDQTPAEPDRWYSDAALAKQVEFDRYPPGAKRPLELFCGIFEPRVQPTDAEKCRCCSSDARDEVWGEERGVYRYCSICIGRGHDEDDD